MSAPESLVAVNKTVKSQLDSLVKKTNLDKLLSEPLFSDESNVVDLFQDIDTNKDIVIGAAFSNYILDSLKSYRENTSKLLSKEDDLLKFVFVVIDVGISSSQKYQLPLLPMEIFHHIMIQFPTDFVATKFGPAFFSSTSNERRSIITLNKLLEGKRKPGTTFLQIGNNILSKVSSNFKEYDEFSAKLRIFINDSFGINDKILSNRDWSYNNLNNIYSKFLDSQKQNSNNYYGSNQRHVDIGNGSRMYSDYLSFCAMMCNPFELIKDLNIKPQDRRSYNKPTTALFFDLARNIFRVVYTLNGKDKNLIPQSFGTKDSKLTEKEIELLKKEYDSKIFETDWIHSENDFRKQLQNYRSRLCMLVHLYIALDFLSLHSTANWNKELKLVNTNPKLKISYTPPVLLTNLGALSVIEDIKGDIVSHLTKFDPKFLGFLQYLCDVEQFWRRWKLKSFNVDSLNGEISEDKKRKAEEQLEKQLESKEPFGFPLGSAKLTKIWRVETGLEKLKKMKQDKDELLDDYRMELYRLSSEIESSEAEGKPVSQELRAEKDSIHWKAMSVSSQLGNWTKFNHTNERVGVEGLFNPDLLEEDLQKQKALKEEQLKEAEDKKEDIQTNESQEDKSSLEEEDQANGNQEEAPGDEKELKDELPGKEN